MLFSRPPSRARSCALLLLLLACAFLVRSGQAQSSRKTSAAKASPSPAPTKAPSPSPAAFALPDPVASVDGVAIHRDDLERITGALLANEGRTVQSLSEEDKKKVYASVLQDIITDRLVNRAAAGEQVNDMEVEKRYNELRSQYATPGAFDAEILKSGQSPDQVRENLRVQLAQQQWIEHQIADEIKVTPEEVEKFYKEGPPSKFDAPEMVRASHILIACRQDAPPEQVQAAEQRANDLEARLKKGESFETLARENSDDPNAKAAESPGDLDYFSRERIMPEFADAAFKLKVGEVSPPVRTQFGFHIIKLTDRKPAHTATLDEARDQIVTFLQTEKRRDAVAKLIDSLKSGAKIENFLKL